MGTIGDPTPDDVQQHQYWVRDMRARAAAEVRKRAEQGLQVEVSAEQGDLLLGRLVRSLAVGIRASQDPYLGKVEAWLTGQLAPKSFDNAKVFSSLGDGADPQTTFLRTLAMAALDPIDPFGNDLVSHITTGCVLHAYAAGVDRATLLRKWARQKGQRAVLDTPILIDLIDPKRLAGGIERAIRTAVAAQWEARGARALHHRSSRGLRSRGAKDQGGLSKSC